jgi:hypothetical protein
MASESQLPVQIQQEGLSALRLPEKEFNVEYQKYLVDPNPLQIVFYCKFAGWEKTTDTTDSTILGIKIKDESFLFKPNKFTRMCNESGANYLFNSVYPLISQHVTTSFLDDHDIYNTYHGVLKAVRYRLLDSYFYVTCKTCYHKEHKGKDCYCGCASKDFKPNKNPYDLNIDAIPDIMAYMASLYNITKKAKGGQFLKEVSETFLSTTLTKMGFAPEQEKKGWLDKLNPFKK